MSKKANEHAERAEKHRVEKARKAQEKAEKDERGRVEKARKIQEKAEGVERERVESVRQDERARVFQEVLSGAGKSKGCCEPCNYHVRTSNGGYQPCKMGHKDSGPDKEICVDCSESHYRPKK
jgi:hypothetical protein